MIYKPVQGRGRGSSLVEIHIFFNTLSNTILYLTSTCVSVAACLHTCAQTKHAHAYSNESRHGNRGATQGNNLAESGTHCKKVSSYCKGPGSKVSERTKTKAKIEGRQET